MKTILLVDDDKTDRKHLKELIRKSDIPFEVILECENGEMALELLREQEIDVMLTDICMPLMDGIELAEKMSELPHRPLTVAVSGHDDFSYAVELMRCGVRDYLLKPVEKERLMTTLKRLDRELLLSRTETQSNRQMGYQQLKYLVMNEEMTEKEIATLREKGNGDLLGDPYIVCIRRHSVFRLFTTDYIYLDNVLGNDLFLVPVGSVELVLKNELSTDYVGLSDEHRGIDELRGAYGEALRRRKLSFFTGEAVTRTESSRPVPEKLREEAEKLLSAESHLKRIQLTGTEKTGDLEKAWDAFFKTAAALRFSPEQFEKELTLSVRELGKTYRNAVKEEDHLAELLTPWAFPTLSSYREEFLKTLLILHSRIAEQYDSGRTDRKMRSAVAYIRENYAKELNMAVVSNYISMNYSLFSYSFKQYTGSNFVNYLKNIRMEEAKRLLTETELKVGEISRRVGYDNEKHFMKTFKTSCGVSPSEYRKNTAVI